MADFYQKLEWIHPFMDGQGRTDLVLLSKLLCDEGFNPPILMQPYISSWEPLETWKDYLKMAFSVGSMKNRGEPCFLND
ncbi:MAG: Fic family protein [Parachlamydiaceae bacterium]|nr:MAG: Fic family protein [Parachlamydiaceae bacterium]